MASKNYTIEDDGSITFPNGEVSEQIRKNAQEKAAREKATQVEDDVDLREIAEKTEGKTEREKASN